MYCPFPCPSCAQQQLTLILQGKHQRNTEETYAQAFIKPEQWFCNCLTVQLRLGVQIFWSFVPAYSSAIPTS